MDLKTILIHNNVVTSQQYEEALGTANQLHSDIMDIIISKGYISEDTLGEIIGKTMGVPYINLTKKEINPDILKILPKDVSIEKKVIPFEKTPYSLKIGMVNPTDLRAIEFVKKGTGYNVEIYYITEKQFRDLLKRYTTGIREEFQTIIEKHVNESKQAIGNGKGDDNIGLPIIKMVDLILENAITEEASDIHMESLEYESIIRYRVDGVLHDVVTIPKDVYIPVIARIKILANLKIDEHRLPQDGRFKININDQQISFRVSIIPTFYGEKIVMRLLEDSARKFNLSDLGLSERDLETVSYNIKRPNGMILVTGPTGSGKSTTLYTILSILNTPEVNINTVEDPIEYSMPRVNQMQVNPPIGLTFASGLRAFLRQDPNIIMVGEIRDSETADIAVNAAMTGHLVLSTLHTNDSAGAIPRLIDMHIEPFLIASTLNIVVAQRLVRKLCTSCKKPLSLDNDSKKTLVELFKNEIQMGSKNVIKIIDENEFFQPVGCPQCNNGYKGRIGIYEVLEVTPKVKELITGKANAGEIMEEAIKNGLTLMKEDGLRKAKLGITSIEEVLRVTKE